jgi:LDH2 family malate/lactate/ureidoglycolate dehydrogenase
MPGDRGIARRTEQLRDGVTLHPTIAPMLAQLARKFGLNEPRSL